MASAFENTQDLIRIASRMNKFGANKALMSGAAAAVVVHDIENQILTIAHVGNVMCCLNDETEQDKMVGRRATCAHVPNLKDERARIEKTGASVVYDNYANHRVYAKGKKVPALNMSRCLGDLYAHSHCGVIAEPDVVVIDLKTKAPGQELPDLLVLGSDAIWEFLTPVEAMHIATAAMSDGGASGAAQNLEKEARARWIKEEGGIVVDDITALVVKLKE